MHPGEVRGAVVGQGQQHAGEQGAHRELAGAAAGGQQRLDRPGDPERSTTCLEAGERDCRLTGCRRAERRRGSRAGSRAAIRSPRRWEQVIPAAAMNVARPRRSAQAASQVARSQAGVQPGQAGPARQRTDQRGGHVPPPGVAPAGDQAGPGERRGGQQQVVVAGQDRHGPGPAAADPRHDAAGPADDVAAADLAQVRAGQPSARARADQPGRTHPPRRRAPGRAPARARYPAISAAL